MLRGRTHFLLALAVAASLDCFAFQATQDRFGSIQGTVTNALTGEPLRKVYVRLVPVEGNEPFANSVTDQEGKFAFSVATPGSYHVEAERPGFLDGQYSDEKGSEIAIRLNAGDKLGNVSIKLMPQGAVSGRVVDEDGDVWTHGQVSLAKLVFKNGRRQLQEHFDRSGLDDLGQFRIAELPAGRYFLLVTPDDYLERGYRSGNTRLQNTWYPGAADATGSTPLILAAGQTLSGLEVRLRRGPVAERIIRGKVSTMEGIPASTVQFTLASEPFSFNFGSGLGWDGSFEITVPAAGSYNVVVFTSLIPRLALGESTVAVDDHDVGNVVIEVKPPLPLNGVIHIEGDNKIPLSPWVVDLQSLGRSVNIPAAVSQPDGKFEFRSLAQESYRVRVGSSLAGQFYLKQIRFGNMESQNGTFTFAGGGTPLELVVSPKPAALTVSITPSKVSAQRVVLIPDTADVALREYRTAVAVRDQNGIFSLRGLAPGAYRLFAFESVPEDAWKDAEFVQAIQAKGSKIQVEEGDSRGGEVPVLLKSEIVGVLAALGID